MLPGGALSRVRVGWRRRVLGHLEEEQYTDLASPRCVAVLHAPLGGTDRCGGGDGRASTSEEYPKVGAGGAGGPSVETMALHPGT